jgi:hypothetical protein
MKKTIFVLPLFLVSLTCAKFPILSDLYNNRIQVILKGTYESNNPYPWMNTYTDDSIAAPYGGGILTPVPQTDVSLYLDIAEIRLAVGTGKPANLAPEKYWVFFTPTREVFCSNNFANGDSNYKLLSCYNDHGDQNFADFFSSGFTLPAVDVPEKTYNHMAIYFRKLITGPVITYTDISGNGAIAQTTTFDNRYLNGINLMDSIVQYSASDTTKVTPLLFPLQRTDLSLAIPSGRDPYVMEVRIFLKNLLMKHVIKYTGGNASAGPLTFVGPSDWNTNHNSSDPTLAYQMGGNIIFTARIYDPANVGSIAITDTLWAPVYKAAYYTVVAAGSQFSTGNSALPYAATSLTPGVGGTITNLPPGSYDLYRTCDLKLMDTSNALVNGVDGYPETTALCNANVTVTAGSSTGITITGGAGCAVPATLTNCGN